MWRAVGKHRGRVWKSDRKKSTLCLDNAVIQTCFAAQRDRWYRYFIHSTANASQCATSCAMQEPCHEYNEENTTAFAFWEHDSWICFTFFTTPQLENSWTACCKKETQSGLNSKSTSFSLVWRTPFPRLLIQPGIFKYQHRKWCKFSSKSAWPSNFLTHSCCPAVSPQPPPITFQKHRPSFKWGKGSLRGPTSRRESGIICEVGVIRAVMCLTDVKKICAGFYSLGLLKNSLRLVIWIIIN